MQRPNDFDTNSASVDQLEALASVLVALVAVDNPGGHACRLLSDVNRELQERVLEESTKSEAAVLSRDIRELMQMHQTLERMDTAGRFGGLRDHMARTVRCLRDEARYAVTESRR